ncbi:MAG: sigma-54-dependent Fis family transcriptional regulator [Deltaproteobacteria bacterium HGW-Deltaproteobacteria-19]|jgi:two-component system response regulator FlrC|nr:MAG: sigma-54-dependent Fis family transcriptional regulator [Deltaproteobacteria bacterium HGW-Deltaproteobacteria-19]
MEATHVLVVDDDPSMRDALSESLEICGFEVDTAEDGAVALKMFAEGKYDVVVTDMRMPRVGGMDVLREIKRQSPGTPVILATAYGTVNTAVEAMKEGASEFITKPFTLDDLEFIIRNVLASHEAPGKVEFDPAVGPAGQAGIITADPTILEMLNLLRRVADSRSTVLIQGESGTGKELFARFVYLNSGRNGKPFVAVNCAAIPQQLLESEMFGYEKGAFTGAVQRKIGKFELAHGGTLLLDEIGDMDVNLQAKLLRVIQESKVDRVGGREPVPVDVRIIVTTNVDLKKAAEDMKFRRDLYWRLSVIPVKIPALRERRNDVPLLAAHFLQKYSQVNGRPAPALDRESQDLLLRYDWPGNVRELENVMERAVLLCEEGIVRPEHLHLEGFQDERTASPAPVLPVQPPGKAPPTPGMTLRDAEKAMIFKTLKEVNGNRTTASKILGISVRTMRNKLHEYEEEDRRS